jgi:hypothetical protein
MNNIAAKKKTELFNQIFDFKTIDEVKSADFSGLNKEEKLLLNKLIEIYENYEEYWNDWEYFISNYNLEDKKLYFATNQLDAFFENSDQFNGDETLLNYIYDYVYYIKEKFEFGEEVEWVNTHRDGQLNFEISMSVK